MKPGKDDKVIEIKIGDKLVDVSFKNTHRFNILLTNTIQKNLRQFVKIPDINLNIDLSSINFIDSAGFQSILSMLEITKKYRSRLTISNINNDVCELIRLLNLQHTFNCIQKEIQHKITA